MRLAVLLLVVACAHARFERFGISNFQDASARELVQGYIKWHNEQYGAARAQHCETVRAVVWRPLAGLGDGAYSLAHVAGLAMQSGRMLFIDWTIKTTEGSGAPLLWNQFLREPGIRWDWDSAQREGAVCGAAVAGMVPCDDMDPVGENSGALRRECSKDGREHRLIATDAFEAEVMGHLLLPSAATEKLMLPVAEQLAENFVVAVAVRTGWSELKTSTNSRGHLQQSHLERGDESEFARCAAAMQHQLLPELREKLLFLVTSDNAAVQDALVAQLRAAGMRTAHAAHAGQPSHIHLVSDRVSGEGVQRSFADFFLLGLADVALLTGNSLFADAATKRAGPAVLRRY
eukprot:g5325.t1